MSKRWMPPEEWKALQEEREQERAEISARILTRIEITEAWPDKWEIAFPDLYSSITSFIEKALSDVLDTVGDYVFNPLVQAIEGVWTSLYNAAKEGFDLVEGVIAGLGWPWKDVARIFLAPFAFAYTFLKPVITWVWDQISPLLNVIKGALDEVGTALYNALPEPLKAFADTIGAIGTAIWTTLNDFVTDPVGTLKAGWDFMAGKVGEIGAGITAAFEGAYNWLATNIGDPILNGIGQIGSWVADALKGVAEALGGALSGFFDWIVKHLTWLGQMIFGAIEAVVTAVQGIISTLVGGFIDSLTGAFTWGSPQPEISQKMNVMVQQMTNRVHDEIKKLYKSPPTAEEVITAAVGIAGLLGTAVLGVKVLANAADAAHPTKSIGFGDIATTMVAATGTAMAMSAIIRTPIDVGLLTPLKYAYQGTFTPYVPSEGELVDMATRRILTGEDYYAPMRKQGLSLTWADRRLQASWRIPGFGELSQMVWREKLTLVDLEGALRSQGVREDFIPGYVELTKAIPPWRDLVTMAVREVFPPEDFYVYMPLHGFSREWAERYWEMHWILLPLGEVRRARHRDVINDDETAKYLVLHDYKPEPRPGIRISDQEIASKLVWDLPGAIMARWMFRWGIKDRDGLKDLLIKGGLDPEYADDGADAVATNQFLREIRMQETNIKADLRDGYIDEETARADFAEIGYPDAFIEYHIADALKDRERSHKKDLLSHYRDCFLKDIPTAPPFEEAVREILVVPEAADLFIERVYVQKIGKKVAA